LTRLPWAACLILLAACARAEPPPMSVAEWSLMQEALGTNPQARLAFQRECLVDEDLWRDREASQALAVFLDVEESEVVRITCERLVAAFARGDFDYDDYLAMNRDPPDTAAMRRLFRALRRQPGQIES
jgi:hypothetical protein